MTDRHATIVSGSSIRIEGRLERADRERDPYRHVPFEIPPGVRALRIELRHDPPGSADHPDDGAVLDLGLIGPGSVAIGTEAFRGWSGSERASVLVGETRATPGYRPGPITPGQWNVILGLYGIPDGGCRYTLDIELLDSEPGAPADPLPTIRQAGSGQGVGQRWYACDLHVHSVHSDGADELPALAATARRVGLDVLASTDHNTDSHHPWLAAAGETAGVALLPGEEVTTYGGHMNAIGATTWVDFRHRTAAGIRGAIDAIHAAGGLASVNHPRGNACAWAFGDDLPVDLIEVWNGPWSGADEESLAWWYELVAAGRRPTPVGGSDCHDVGNPDTPLGTPTTWVLAGDPSRASIIDALASARVALTSSPSDAPPLIEIDGGTMSWEVPVSTSNRRLVIRSIEGAVKEATIAAGLARGRLTLATDRRASLAAAEVRDPTDALLALVPLFNAGGR